MKGRLDQLTAEQKERLEQKEQFLAESVSLQGITLGTPHEEKTQGYASQVLDFVESGKNQDYFLGKGHVTYTMLEPYRDFVPEWKLRPVEDPSFIFQPASEKLRAYANGASADTVRYELTLFSLISLL